MSCAPAWTAESATKPRAASCVAACRSASSGAKLTAKCCSIPTKPFALQYVRFSSGFKSSARRVACGYGFAAKVWIFHCRSIPQHLFALLRQPTSLFTTYFVIQSMRAHTRTVSRVESTPSMNTATVTNALAFYRVSSGRCFFVRITKVISIGPRLKPTRRVWPRTHTLNPTRQEQDH